MKRAFVALLALCITAPVFANILAAFSPEPGNAAKNIAVTASSTTVSVPSGTLFQYMLTNVGANAIYFEMGIAGSTPVASTTTSAELLPNSQVIVTGPPNAVFAVIAGATGNTLNIVPGEGE